MPGRKRGRPLLKKDIEIAYRNSNSATEAARYLDVSYKTFKKYAKYYGIWRTNQSGKGVPRPKKYGKYGLFEILDGKYPRYNRKILLERCFKAGIFKKKCYMCGYNVTRDDGRAPLIFYHKDGNLTNLKKDNIEPRCYNCQFLTNGRSMDKKISQIPNTVFQKDLIDAQDGEALSEAVDSSEFEDLQKEFLDEVERERKQQEEDG